jgi:hypothetical protein
MTTAARMTVRSVPELFPASTIVCVASGPSLTQDDVNFCRGKARVIAINDAYRLCPWADVLYGCDAAWWNYHQGVPTFAGLKYSLEAKAAVWPGVQVLRNAGREGLSLERDALCTGLNSGYQSLNCAVHLGAKRILLLGYDMQTAKGKSHWFGEHPPTLSRGSQYQKFREHFATLVEPLRQLGIEVLNCTPNSALRCFPMATLHDALSREVAA